MVDLNMEQGTPVKRLRNPMCVKMRVLSTLVLPTRTIGVVWLPFENEVTTYGDFMQFRSSTKTR